MNIDEIKQLMKAGDIAGAEAAARELLAAEPANVQAKLLFGTCRQLQGDEETFRRIHDELAPAMEQAEKAEPASETVSLWRKYKLLWMSLIVGALVVGAAALAMSGGGYGVDLYAGPPKMISVNALYAGPPRRRENVDARTDVKQTKAAVEEANKFRDIK